MLNKYFGDYGGMFVPETLVTPLKEVEQALVAIQDDVGFQREFQNLLLNYAGRPTPVTHAKNLSKHAGCNIYLKREDLLHGGAHKTNNTLGQALLAKKMGKTRMIAETGAGQHGVATAMAGALLGIPVDVYMGSVDVARQAMNVERMKLFGATVHSVDSGSATLKDAINDALRDWVTNANNTYYCFGTAAGPYPFPSLVAYMHRIIGVEAREQMLTITGALPDAAFACVGGGSNAIGLFSGFVDDERVQLFGAEAAGEGLSSAKHAATLLKGELGVFHGMHSKFVQDIDGQIAQTHSISAGLDYPGIGPEHVLLQEKGRVTYLGVTDEEALNAFELIAKEEGILAAFESCHAIALTMREAKRFNRDANLLINVSGRGDKDLECYVRLRGAV